MADYSTLKRGEIKRIPSLFKELPDGKLIATKRLILTIPEEYAKQGLVETHEDFIELTTICAVIDESTNTWYAMRTPAVIKTVPSNTQTRTYKNMKYVEYVYEEGAVVIMSKNILKNPRMIPKILSLLLWRAIIPHYYISEDTVTVLTRTGRFAGLSIDKIKAIVEVLVSLTSRNKETLKLTRYDGKVAEDTVAFKGLQNRAYSTDHPFRMLLGGHESKAFKVMVTKEPTQTTLLEEALR